VGYTLEKQKRELWITETLEKQKAYNLGMKSLGELLQTSLELKTAPNQKAEVIEQIFAIYSSEREKEIRRKRKVRNKDYTLERFSIFLHSRVKDIQKLYEILSIGRDMEKRNQCFSAWLFWNVKKKV
jgi:hypothetical protein